MEITFRKCTFTSNEACATQPTEGDSNLFGGSAIFQSVVKSVILKCKFKSNSGSNVKLYSQFEGTKDALQLSSENSLVSINDCQFEVNEKVTNSIFYVHSLKNEIPTKVIDCVFTGKLAKNYHHIDGSYSTASSAADATNKKKNFFVKSCLFVDGISQALNADVSSFDLKSLKFNYNGRNLNKSDSNAALMPVLLTIICVCSVSAIIAVAVLLFKKKDDSQEEESNEA